MQAPGERRRPFIKLLVAFAVVAFIGRVVYVVTVTKNETKLYDSFFYIQEANTLAAGKGFITPFFGSPNADHPPLTVVTLAPVSWLTNHSDLAMRLTMALLGSAVVVLVGLIAVEVAGRRAGLVAAGIAVVYPNLWMNDGLVMGETLATLTAAAVIFCCYQLARQPTFPNAIGAGLACGLAMLTRGELPLLIPLVLVPTIVSLRSLARGRRWKLVGVSVVAALALVAPWIGYNMSRFERATFLSTSDGITLLGANCDAVYFGDQLGGWSPGCLLKSTPFADASVHSARQRRLAFRYVRDHLDRLPVVVPARVGRAWSLYAPIQMAEENENEGRPVPFSIAGLAMFWLLALLAIGGLVTLRRRRVLLIPLVGPLVMVTVVAALFFGVVRYRVAAEITIVVLAAVAIDALCSRTMSKRIHVHDPARQRREQGAQRQLGSTRS